MILVSQEGMLNSIIFVVVFFVFVFLCVVLAVLKCTVDQAGLDLGSPASASQILGIIKACATITWLNSFQSTSGTGKLQSIQKRELWGGSRGTTTGSMD